MLESLRQKYRASFKDKARELQLALDTGNSSDLITQVHRLAGSSGSYGFAELAEMCQEIEATLQTDSDIPQDMIQALIEHLAEQAAHT